MTTEIVLLSDDLHWSLDTGEWTLDMVIGHCSLPIGHGKYEIGHSIILPKVTTKCYVQRGHHGSRANLTAF